MIKLHTIPEYHDELIIDGQDYNGYTPDDEIQYEIESNIEFIENEEAELKQIIASEPQN
ncbi:hypothetical protein [Methanobrevibacter sp.]|uniref:hypothetical protein n=1 Tax=Methanobrevibacter sp. TaxID=66852 RepID=UPI003868245C